MRNPRFNRRGFFYVFFGFKWTCLYFPLGKS
jgi:hypothetical protein